MTEDRDHRIAAALETLPVPEHGPDFWLRVRSALADAAPAVAAAARAAGSSPPLPDTDPKLGASTDGGVEVITLNSGRRTPAAVPRHWLAAAAAAVALVGAACALALLRDDGQPVDTGPAGPTALATTDPSTAVAPTELGATPIPTTPEVATGPLTVDYHQIVEQRALGSGRVLAIDPSGAFAYVADLDPSTFELGCEGAPLQTVWTIPLAGGERYLSAPAPGAGISFTGGALVAFGPDGQVALLSICEGFAGELWVGRLAADGRLADVTPVGTELPETINALDWTVDGSRLLATAGIPTVGAAEPYAYQLVSIDPGSDTIDVLADGVIRFAATADGRLATLSTDGTVTFDGTVLGTEQEAYEIAVSSDGAQVGVAGAVGGLAIYHTVGGAREVIEELVNAASVTLLGEDEPRAAAVIGSGRIWLQISSVGEIPPTDGGMVFRYVMADDLTALVLSSVRYTEDGSYLGESAELVRFAS